MKLKLLSHVQLFVTPLTVACQAPPSMGFSRQEYWSEMYRENNMETYITICKIDSQWEFAVWLRKLKQGLCINLEGWDGEGDGREFQKGGGICIPMTDSCWGLTENTKFYKAIILQLKKKKNSEVGCHFLLQGIFLMQRLNLGLPHWWQTLYHLSHQRIPSCWQIITSNYSSCLLPYIAYTTTFSWKKPAP